MNSLPPHACLCRVALSWTPWMSPSKKPMMRWQTLKLFWRPTTWNRVDGSWINLRYWWRLFGHESPWDYGIPLEVFMRWQHFCCARPPLKLCRTHFDPARGGMFKQIGLIALQCAAFWGFIFDLLRPFAVKPHALDTCGQYPCMGWKVAPLLPDYCHKKIGLWNFYWWIDIHGISRSKLSHVLSYIYI